MTEERYGKQTFEQNFLVNRIGSKEGVRLMLSLLQQDTLMYIKLRLNIQLY